MGKTGDVDQDVEAGDVIEVRMEKQAPPVNYLNKYIPTLSADKRREVLELGSQTTGRCYTFICGSS